MHHMMRPYAQLGAVADLQACRLPPPMVHSQPRTTIRRNPILELGLPDLLVEPPPGLSLTHEMASKPAVASASGTGQQAEASDCSTADPSTAEPSEASSVPGSPCLSRQTTPDRRFSSWDAMALAAEPEVGSPVPRSEKCQAAVSCEAGAREPPSRAAGIKSAFKLAGSTYSPGNALRQAILGLPSASAARGAQATPAASGPLATDAAHGLLRPSAVHEPVVAPAAPSRVLRLSAAVLPPQAAPGSGKCSPAIPQSDMVPPPPPPPGLSVERASVGSAGHNSGLCRPCDFTFRPGGCRQGAACQFCHTCGPEALKRWKKERKLQLRQLRQKQGATTAVIA